MPKNNRRQPQTRRLLLLAAALFLALPARAADWHVIPGADREIDAVIDEIENGGRAETEWQELVEKAGFRTFDLLLAIRVKPKFEKGLERGLEVLLKAKPAGLILDHLKQQPQDRRKQLIGLFDYCLYRDPNPTRKQMLVMYGLQLDKRTVFHARNLWYVTQDRLAVAIAALAVRRGGLQRQTWENAGQRLHRYRRLNPLRTALELSFYVGLAGKLDAAHVVPRLLEIANVRRAGVDVTRLLATELLEQGFETEVQELLSGTGDPALMFHMLRLFNKQLEMDMPKADWDKIYAAAETERALFRLAGQVAVYAPEKLDEVNERILGMPPQNSIIDALVLQEMAVRAEHEGRFAKAAALYERYAAAKRVSDPGSKLAAKLKTRADRLRQLPKIDPQPLLAARAADRRQDYAAAVKGFRAVRNAHPELHVVHFQLLDALAARHDHAGYARAAAALLQRQPLMPDEELIWAKYCIDVMQVERALALINGHLKKEPDTARAYLLRAAAHERAGNVDAAAADFETAARKGLQRGLLRPRALLYARHNKLPEAIELLEEYLLTQNPEDDHARIWLHLLRRRRKIADNEALAGFVQARGDAADPWAKEIFAYLLGQLTAAELRQRATATKDPFRRRGRECEALFYTAQTELLNGNSARAKDLLERVVAMQITTFVEHIWALAELKRLK